MRQTYLVPPLFLSATDFVDYVRGLKFVSWRPRLPYLHNTGVPSLHQIKAGKVNELAWGVNLEHYYRGLGWHAGPHAVACPDGIVCLSDFTMPGVAQSCSNDRAWAIEMLGNYEKGADDFASGDGAKVRDNAAKAIAVMAEKMEWDDLAFYYFNVKGLHFHHECVQDHHACPGSLVVKSDMLTRIAANRALLRAVHSTDLIA